MHLFKNANYNFVRWRWHALVASLVVVVVGIGVIAIRGLPLGIDFSGGTIVVVRFTEPVMEDQVRRAVDPIPGEKIVQRYGDAEGYEKLIRLPQTVDVEEGAALEEGAVQIVDLLRQADLPQFEVLSTEVVGPVIGADLQRKGIYATVFAILGITIYIGWRFRFSFAAGALAALLHDVFVTLSFLTLFGYELSLNVVAAVLTIAGYSVNDTIVIFDRVRENMRTVRREGLEQVVNRSVNQTLARTVITSGTTLMAVLALFLFGGEVLRSFAFTMIVGIVAGTYSTVFIASSLAIALTERGRRRSHAAAPPAEAPAGPGKPRRARAS
jgi:preprotein translocase SecF subunit